MVVILRLIYPAQPVDGLWHPPPSSVSMLRKYTVKPCLMEVVQYYVAGVAANVKRSMVISFGTMCSGTDYISEVFQCVSSAFNERFGQHCKLSLNQLFAVESDPDMRLWCELQAKELGFQPKMYKDMNSLPLHDMPRCEVLLAGTSCQGLSTLNSNQKSLLDINPDDRLCSSGNTMEGHPFASKDHQYVITYICSFCF